MRSKSLFASLTIVFCAATTLRADPGDELLKTPNKNDSSAPRKLTYKLSNGSENWDADPKSKITKAMDEAVALYNKYGDFQRVLTANWNPGTPTADANFGGWINFGGQIGTRTALHEIAHTLGIGTAPNWSKFSVDGKWTGQYGINQLKEFDGPDAVLHCDRQHFWPYGLNYDTEVKPDSFRRNVLMVTAMRADMGLGPPPHPATAALKAAFADATEAHDQVDRAQSSLNQTQSKLRAGMSSRPEIIAASRTAAAAKSAYDAAVTLEIKSLQQNESFKTLQAAAVAARKKMDALQADSTAKSEDRENAAKAMLSAKSVLTQFENKDLDSAPSVVAAKKAYHSAILEMGTAQKSLLENDPAVADGKKALEAAVAKAMTADQAVAAAEAAAIKEKKSPVVSGK